MLQSSAANRRTCQTDEPDPHPRPCNLEPCLAVVEINPGAALAAERQSAIGVAFPPPLRRVVRRPGTFHDPANRQTVPDHLIVVGHVGIEARSAGGRLKQPTE